MKIYKVSFELIKENKSINILVFEIEIHLHTLRLADYTTGQTIEYKTSNIKNLKIEEEQNKWQTL